jgi:hypothetical protein
MNETPRTDALEEKWRYATEARGNLSKALDDMFNEYGQLECELNEAYYIINELNEIEPKNRDYDVWGRADAWLERNKK